MANNRDLILERKTNKKKEEYKYFVGTTLKDPLSYTVGENIIFKIRVKYMDGFLDIPYIRYSLTVEHGEDRDGYIEKSADGWFYIETSLCEAGFAYLNAEACDESKVVIEGIEAFNGSAGADVASIRRATEIPSDYLEFWANMKKEVKATEPAVIYSKEIEDPRYPDYTILDMRIKAPRNSFASLSVSYPKSAKKGSLRLAMLFQGYGVNPATPHPLEGYLTVHVAAHAIPNDRAPEFYKGLYTGVLDDYGYDTEENERPKTTYFCGMLLRDLAALSFFEDHELINKKDYYFVGSSQGGMQALNMAAHFDKATAVILNVPWLSDIYGCELGGRRENGMPKGRGITYFDTAVAAEYVKCPVYMISGLGDKICNTSTQIALFNSLKSRKYIELYQNKTHSLTIPWDNLVYTLGDLGMKEMYREHTEAYYDFN